MVDPQLEWHVQSCVLASLISLAAAQIVDTKFRAGYKLNDAFKPIRRIVGVLWGKPWMESKVDNAERNSLEQRGKVFVKRAIDENRSFKRRRDRHPFGGCGSLP